MSKTGIHAFVLVATMALMALVLAACGEAEEAPDAEAQAPSEPTTTEAEASESETESQEGESEAASDDVSPELIAAAEAEGVMTSYQSSWGDPNMWAEFEAGIEERWGIDVTLTGQEGPSVSALVGQLTEEFNAGRPPSTDVFKASSLHTVPLSELGALEEVDWMETCPWVTEESITSGGSMVMGAEFTAAIINTDLIPLEDAPETYEELMDPRFEGLIATTPYAGHWPQIGVAMGGVDKLIPILEEITTNGNVEGFIALSDAERVASGEFGMLVPTGEQDIIELKEAGAPVEVLKLGREVANSYMYEILKGTKAPNLAKLVGCYIMTPEGQDILYRHQTYDSPYIEGRVAYEKWNEALSNGSDPLLTTPDLYLDNLDAFEDFAQGYGALVGSR